MAREDSEPTKIDAYLQLAEWYAQPLGRQLAEEHSNRLAPVLSGLFGYHLLQVGGYFGNMVQHTSIRHCVKVSPALPTDLVALPEALPIATDSVDVVLLAHTLEIDPRPHQVLREVERVLIPEGSVVILGFNPWSLMGLWRWLPTLRAGMPLSGQFFSLSRIRDWLTLLDFEVTHTEFFFYRPPVSSEILLRKLRFIEPMGQRFFYQQGGTYIVVARKRVVTLTPLRRKKVTARRVLAPGYAHHGG
ncbi:MAG: class I SAM-dependent methyltransferase [Gammaproteobacteria bacterium]|nr:class I SAM-dependent methyltransferase [Gammaproteobacteria bacterium]